MADKRKVTLGILTIIGLVVLVGGSLAVYAWIFVPRTGEYFGMPTISSIEKISDNTYEIKFSFHEAVVILPYEGELPEYVVEGNKVILSYTLEPTKITDIAPEGGRASTAEAITVLAAVTAIPLVAGFLLFKKPGWCK